MKTIPSRWKVLIVGAAVILVALVSIGLTPASESVSISFPHATLVIEPADGKPFSFDIELATTTEQHARGLMFRRTMPRDAGMLFLFEPDQPVDFWMKNTFIPLDMLFVRADGVIIKVVTHAEPFSTAMISSNEPVRGVIEINAGEADRRGIRTGDKVIYPAFARPAANH